MADETVANCLDECRCCLSCDLAPPPPSGFHTYAGDIERLRLRLRFIDERLQQPSGEGRIYRDDRRRRRRADLDHSERPSIAANGEHHSSERTNNNKHGNNNSRQQYRDASFVLSFDDSKRQASRRWILSEEEETASEISGLQVRAISSADSDWSTTWRPRLLADQRRSGIARATGPSGSEAWPTSGERATDWEDTCVTSGVGSPESEPAPTAAVPNCDSADDDADYDDSGSVGAALGLRSAAAAAGRQAHLFERAPVARKLRSAEWALALLAAAPPSQVAPVGRQQSGCWRCWREERDEDDGEGEDNLCKSVTATTSSNQMMIATSMLANGERANRSASLRDGCARRDCDKTISRGAAPTRAEQLSDWYLGEWLLNANRRPTAAAAGAHSLAAAAVCSTNNAIGLPSGHSNGLGAGDDDDDDDDDEDEDEEDDAEASGLVSELLEVSSAGRRASELKPPPASVGTTQRPPGCQAKRQHLARQSVELIYIVMENSNNARDEFAARGGGQQLAASIRGGAGADGASGAAASLPKSAAGAGCVTGASGAPAAAAAAASSSAAGAAIATTTSYEEETAPISDFRDKDDSKVQPDCTSSSSSRANGDGDGDAVGARRLEQCRPNNAGDDAVGANRQQQPTSLSAAALSSDAEWAAERMQQEESAASEAQRRRDAANDNSDGRPDKEADGAGADSVVDSAGDAALSRSGARLNCAGRAPPQAPCGATTVLAVIAIDKLNRFIQLKPDLNELISIHSAGAGHHSSGEQASEQPASSWRQQTGAAAGFAGRQPRRHIYRLEVAPSCGGAGQQLELDRRLKLVRDQLRPSAATRKSASGGAFVAPVGGSLFVSLQLSLNSARMFAGECRNLHVKYKILLQNSSGAWRLARKFTAPSSSRSRASVAGLSAGLASGEKTSTCGGAKNSIAEAVEPRLAEIQISGARQKEQRRDQSEIKPWRPEKPTDAVGAGGVIDPPELGALRRRPPLIGSANSGSGNGVAGANLPPSDKQQQDMLLLAEGSTITCRPNASGLFHFASAEELLFELAPAENRSQQQQKRPDATTQSSGQKTTDRRPSDDPSKTDEEDARESSAPASSIDQRREPSTVELMTRTDERPDNQQPAAAQGDPEGRQQRAAQQQPTAAESDDGGAKIWILFELFSSDFYADKPQGWAHLCVPLAELTESSLVTPYGAAPRQIDDDSSHDNSNGESLTSWCRRTKKPARHDERRRQQNVVELQVVRPELSALADRLRYYLIGQLPDALPAINEFVESNNRYMLQTRQTGQLLLNYTINRQYSDPQFDSALADLIAASDGIVGRRANNPPLKRALGAANNHGWARDSSRLAVNKYFDENNELASVVDVYRRAKGRIERLNNIGVH